ncbi:MAG: hypothetical protein ACJA1Z_002242 [Patiriisocius sp.]|jgi:hypothetical protein
MFAQNQSLSTKAIKENENRRNTIEFNKDTFIKKLPSFNQIMGTSGNNLNNEISTKLEKDKTTVSINFISYLENKKNKSSFIKGNLSIGESANLFDLNNVEMPFFNSSISLVLLSNNRDYYIPDSSVKIQSFNRFSWVEISVKYKNEEYKMFAATSNFEDQLSKERFSEFGAELSYNFLGQWNKDDFNFRFRPHSVFFNVSYEFGRNNNIKKFDQVLINDYLIHNDTLNNREVFKSQKAFVGNYKEFLNHTISSQILIGIQHTIFIDLFADLSTSADDSPTLGYGVGLFFSAVNKEQKKNENKVNVNVGVFAKWIDNKQPYFGIKTEVPIDLSRLSK